MGRGTWDVGVDCVRTWAWTVYGRGPWSPSDMFAAVGSGAVATTCTRFCRSEKEGQLPRSSVIEDSAPTARGGNQSLGTRSGIHVHCPACQSSDPLARLRQEA